MSAKMPDVEVPKENADLDKRGCLITIFVSRIDLCSSSLVECSAWLDTPELSF